MFSIAAGRIVIVAEMVLLPLSGRAQDPPREATSGEVQERAGRSPETLQPARQKALKPAVPKIQVKEKLAVPDKVFPAQKPVLEFMPDLVLIYNGGNGLYVVNKGKGQSYATGAAVTCEVNETGIPCSSFPDDFVYVKGLNPKEAVKVLGSFYTGQVDVTVKVDPYGEVDESNEGNNTWVSN